MKDDTVTIKNSEITNLILEKTSELISRIQDRVLKAEPIEAGKRTDLITASMVIDKEFKRWQMDILEESNQ